YCHSISVPAPLAPRLFSLSLRDALPIFRLMETDRGPGLGLEPRHAEHVVDVRMGEPDPDRTDALGRQLVGDQPRFLAGVDDGTRSEEHSSELQSRFDLVCRLLLEKKNIS